MRRLNRCNITSRHDIGDLYFWSYITYVLLPHSHMHAKLFTLFAEVFLHEKPFASFIEIYTG